MSEEHIPELITDKTILAVFCAVFIASGAGPMLELLGYTHPVLSIIGAIIGALIAVWEARKVQEKINEAKERALLGTEMFPGLYG